MVAPGVWFVHGTGMFGKNARPTLQTLDAASIARIYLTSHCSMIALAHAHFGMLQLHHPSFVYTVLSVLTRPTSDHLSPHPDVRPFFCFPTAFSLGNLSKHDVDDVPEGAAEVAGAKLLPDTL